VRRNKVLVRGEEEGLTEVEYVRQEKERGAKEVHSC
jgi:hypothetical protein